MTMGRQLSRSQNVVVSAEYQHTKTSGATSAMQAYLAAWQGAFGQRYSLRASAGIRPYSQAGQAGRIAPAVGLGLTARLRRNDSLALSYERSVEQALGIGTHLTQVVTVGYNLSLVRRLSIDASGGYGRGTYPLDPNRLLLGRTGNLSVRYVLVQGLAASVGSSVYVREGTPGPSGTLYRTEISLSYAKAWR